MGGQDHRHRQVSDVRRSVPTAYPSPDELGPLRVSPAGTRDDLTVEAVAAVASTDYREFSTVIAHDLKKYILAIAIDAQRLEAISQSCAGAGQAIANIVRNATHADLALQSLLDTASIEAGQFELRRTAVNLGRLVHDAVDRMSPARRARIDLEVRAKMTAMIDPIRFEHALSTLVHGALDHSTPAARVAVRIESNGSDRARISVVGKEMGGFAEDLEKAFASSDGGRLQHGIAIVLRTIGKVIEAHDGSIVFEADAGTGARLCLDLPATQLRGMLARRQGRSVELDGDPSEEELDAIS